MKKIIASIFATLILIVLSGCSASMVYAPAAALPYKPLEKGNFDVQGGIGLLPETRPDSLGGSPITLGASGQISYAFCDAFALSLKGWGDVEGRDGGGRGGLSLTGLINFPIDKSSHIIFSPKMGLVWGGIGIGAGLGLSTIYQKSLNEKLSFYSGVGTIYADYESTTEENGVVTERISGDGWGILGHFGLTYKLPTNLWFNFEASPIYQINNYDNKENFVLSPTLTIGYTFDKNK